MKAADPVRFVLIVLCASLAMTLVGCDESSGPREMLTGPVSETSAKGEVVDRVCYQLGACDCAAAAGVSLAGCDFSLGFSWDAVVEDAQEAGLTYDGDCLTARLNFMAERGCEKITDSGNITGCGGETCLIYHGDVAEGQPCEGTRNASNCQQGLVCYGTCEQACDLSVGLQPEGSSCSDGTTITAVCDTGLVCDFGGSDTCAALPAAGSPCIQFQCAEGAYCDNLAMPATCVALAATGEACVSSAECDTGNCDGSVCTAAPGEGEACITVCSGDLVCLPDLTTGTAACTALPGDGEACLANVGLECAEGFTCTNGTCAPLPGLGESCEVLCSGDLICGAHLCETNPSAAGCDTCDPGDTFCIVRVCIEEPAAVCSDQGGLIF